MIHAVMSFQGNAEARDREKELAEAGEALNESWFSALLFKSGMIRKRATQVAHLGNASGTNR